MRWWHNFHNLSTKKRYRLLEGNMGRSLLLIQETKVIFKRLVGGRIACPRRSHHGPDLPTLLKRERSLPIRLSTVPAAKRTTQWQRFLECDTNKGQADLWTFVFPFRSFHMRKRTRSRGTAENNDLGRGREKSKILQLLLEGRFLSFIGLRGANGMNRFWTIVDGGKNRGILPSAMCCDRKGAENHSVGKRKSCDHLVRGTPGTGQLGTKGTVDHGTEGKTWRTKQKENESYLIRR